MTLHKTSWIVLTFMLLIPATFTFSCLADKVGSTSKAFFISFFIVSVIMGGQPLLANLPWWQSLQPRLRQLLCYGKETRQGWPAHPSFHRNLGEAESSLLVGEGLSHGQLVGVSRHRGTEQKWSVWSVEALTSSVA